MTKIYSKISTDLAISTLYLDPLYLVKMNERNVCDQFRKKIFQKSWILHIQKSVSISFIIYHKVQQTVEIISVVF